MTILIPAWDGDDLCPVEKLEVHRRGLRHKAVSVFLLSGDATLLQRRAGDKYHTPGLWTNACCTHPAWGESAEACAHRRLAEELGVTGVDLRHRGQVEYRADVGGGMIEHEVVELFAGETPANLPLAPDPAEVSATRWAERGELDRDVRLHPDRYTPWLAIYLGEHSVRIFG